MSAAEESADPKATGTSHWVRRIVHLVSPVFLVYYWMEPHYAGLPKQAFVILAILIVIGFEAARLRFGWRIPGAREYEQKRLSAAAMGGIGLAGGLLLFPQHLVMGCFVGMCLADPLVGEIRTRKLKGGMPIGGFAFAAVFVVIQLVFFPGLPLIPMILFGALAGVVAVYVEAESPKWLDDDLTMHLVPVLALLPIDIYAGYSRFGLP